ncbi:VOC family protein [Pseudomonas sp. NBRC 100443]|uniref:VOC family protein n=1 Tax=Pseudomonas sp. NBRC 100443 TaxID=1113665 RepID=UPI0024A25BF8|nr:VOC family protein [Pseudomonas sp. NBRC 100443]GLU37348.1 glyoxalase [Pseudomonas sp. NBRC 100443]
MPYPQILRRPGHLGVHSIDHFCLSVPALAEAEDFYQAFGLDVRRAGGDLELYCEGHPQRWGRICEGPRKRLEYLSFGAYEEDLPAFRKRFQDLGVAVLPAPPGSDGGGLWLRDPSGLLLEVRPAERCAPTAKSVFDAHSAAAGERGTMSRSQAPSVHPRRLAHIAIFTDDVERSVNFYADVLGLRLSDRSADIVAFLHGAHGSEHHLLALVKSGGPGLHHSSWDVGSVQDIGLGSKQMSERGYTRAWGLGRHVLGANYFYYVRDPWGSHAEYSADMDYIPVDLDWQGTDQPVEDAMYLWGPDVPEDFVTNFELV